MIMTDRLSSVHYSVGGIPQYYNSPLDIIACDITNEIKEVMVNTSVQPNSIPHFGTITTFMGAFLLAQRVQNHFKIKSSVEIDFIDCGPTAKYHQTGGTSCKSIAKTPYENESGKSIAEHYIENYYIPLLNWISNKTGICYKTRRYKEFQEIYLIRKVTCQIYNNIRISKILNPETEKLHIRSECPICGNIDKKMEHTFLTSEENDSFRIHSFCPDHGEYTTLISPQNKQYFEANTQLRDITKGALMSEYKTRNILGIMFDGGDWGGVWTHHVHCKVLNELDYDIPIRLFAPLILDWSGGKLSKSIYRSDAFLCADALENYECFIARFGNKGLDAILNEVDAWLSESKKFFRNYSLDYIIEVLKKIEE